MQHGMIEIDANAFHFKKLQLRASYAVPALWFPRAIELLKARTIDPSAFITQEFPLEKIEEYFNHARNHRSDVIKMVMVKK
jgi:threonine dehydrogenase-like Zn-dependent dehydrogenase